jgi:hypothetical protein
MRTWNGVIVARWTLIIVARWFKNSPTWHDLFIVAWRVLGLCFKLMSSDLGTMLPSWHDVQCRFFFIFVQFLLTLAFPLSMLKPYVFALNCDVRLLKSYQITTKIILKTSYKFLSSRSNYLYHHHCSNIFCRLYYHICWYSFKFPQTSLCGLWSSAQPYFGSDLTHLVHWWQEIIWCFLVCI